MKWLIVRLLNNLVDIPIEIKFLGKKIDIRGEKKNNFSKNIKGFKEKAQQEKNTFLFVFFSC